MASVYTVTAANVGGSITGEVAIEVKGVAAPPATPVVMTPAYVTANQTGYSASVDAQSNSNYAWTIANGTITAGQGTTSITFTAGLLAPRP